VAWGESNQIAPLAYAKAFPSARFEPIVEAGHLPHIEQPARVLDLTGEFAGETSRAIVA